MAKNHQIIAKAYNEAKQISEFASDQNEPLKKLDKVLKDLKSIENNQIDNINDFEIPKAKKTIDEISTSIKSIVTLLES